MGYFSTLKVEAVSDSETFIPVTVPHVNPLWLIVTGSLNDSQLPYIRWRQMVESLVNGELDRLWDVVVANLEVLSRRD
jgi:hypothetical protein